MTLIELGIVWITIFSVTAAEQRCASDKNQPIDASVVSYCSDSIKNYSHIILDVSNNQIIVAARSELSLLPYNLSSTLVTRKNVSAATSDVAMCRLTQKEETCHNYFKLLLKDGSGSIIACGTYADAPKCRFYNETTLSDTTPSAWNSIRDFDGYVPKSPESSNTAVFTVNGSLIVGSPRRPSAYAISRFTPGGKTLNILTVISGTDAGRWLNAPDFVSSYEIGDYVYVFLRETALERESRYEYSRIARVCKNDAGDTFILDKNWVSFVKSEIACEVPASNPPYRYSRVVGTTLIDKAMHNPDATRQDMFYVVFTGAVGSPSGSAVCAYGLSGKYMNDVSSVYNGQYYYWENGFKTDTPSKFMCSPGRAAFDAKKYQLTANPVKQVTTFPLYTMESASATAIAVDQITVNSRIYDIIFLGFDDGRIRKISPVKSSSGSWETKVTETITVTVGEPILQLRVLTHSNISKRLLFVVSSSKVSQLPVQRCDRYDKCSDCVAAQDPFCGWSSIQASCVVSDTAGAVQNITYGKYDSICPKAPATFSLTLQKKTSDSVTVTWSPDSTPSQPYTKPDFRLYKGGQSIANVTNATQYTFSHLQPYTVYNFSIVPVNDFGVGTETRLSNVVTHAKAPSEVVLTVNVRSSTETEIQWSKPRKTNGPLSKYEVFVSKGQGNFSLFKTDTDVYLFNYREHHKTLTPYTNYSYYVSACTDDGFSRCSNSKIVTVQTSTDFPSKPVGVTATTLSSTEILVQWNPPPVINGLVKAYRVIKVPHGEQVPLCCSGSQRSVTVRNLLPYTGYTFRVAAATLRGFGNESDAATAKTAAGQPGPVDAPVLLASVHPKTPQIVVTWKKPNDLKGQLLKYGLCRSPGTCQEFHPSKLSFNDTTVQVCTTYSYTVSILTNGGNSTSTASQTLISGIPGPVTSLTSSVLSAWEIGISWQPPSNINECDIQSYDVLQNGTRVCCIGNQLSHFASSLTPSKSYIFQVAAVTAAGVGSFTALTAETKERRPGKPHSVTLSVSTLTWSDPFPNYGTPTKYKIYKDGQHVGTVTQKSYTVPQNFAKPGKWALYWITAVNGIGEGPPSSSRNASRDETVPGLCAGIYAIPSSETSVLVSWLPPTEQNGVITGYKLRQEKPSRKDFTPGMSRSYTVVGLSVDLVYSFSVAASTKAGTGPYITSNDIHLKMPSSTTCPTPKTDPAGVSTTTVPPPTAVLVPATLTGQVVSSQEISLTWSFPSTMQESQIKNVIIKRTQGSGQNSVKVCCADVRQTFRATELLPYTPYHFSLFVRLKTDIEQNLTSYSGMTKEAAPSKPTNIRASKIANDSITLQWDAPNPPNGAISSYTILQDGEQVEVGRVNGSTTHFTIENLQPYTIYAFRVKAATANDLKIGPFSNRHYFRTSEYLPGKMVKPRLASVSVSIMYVTWDPPDKPNGELLGYRLYRKQAVDNETNPCAKDQVSHETVTNITSQKLLNERVTGLEVGTAYCFAIQAKTAKGYGPVSDYIAAKTFDLAVVGENFTCPSVNFLNDFLQWQDRLNRALPTTEAPTTEAPTTTKNTIINIGGLSGTTKDSSTVTIVVGVIAGLAVITTLTLTVMLFCACRRGSFPVSEVGSPGTLNIDSGKSFGFPLPATSEKMANSANGDVRPRPYISEDFGLQTVSQQMARADSVSEPQRTPDVLAGASKNTNRKPIVAWSEESGDKGSSDVPNSLYEPVQPPDQPQPPSTPPPDDCEETTETVLNDYEDCESTVKTS